MSAAQTLPTDAARKSEHATTIGVVTALDCSQTPPVVKVRLDDGDDAQGTQVTDWIPFTQPRAGASYFFMPPQVGEQGLVVSHGGDMSVLFFVGGIFSAATMPTDASADLTRLRFKNGDTLEHDAQTGTMQIRVSGDLSIHADGHIRITGARIDLN